MGGNVPSSPTRTDLGLHDLTGGNTFLPDILPIFYPELDTAALQDGKQRAIAMLSLAGTMDLTVTPVDGACGDAKIYHIEPGISTRLAPIIGMEAGPSFFFPLSDTVYFDNRIPPRGFTNAAFVTAQSPVVAYSYEDGQYWDDTEYILPITARRAGAHPGRRNG